MNRHMKKIFQLTSILALLALTVLSCTKKEVSTDQYDSTVVKLQAYGPQPVVRGGILRFLGSNLDKVATVTIPGVEPMVPEVVTSGTHSEIRVTVPKDGPQPGFPVLTLADGTTITGVTQITYSEPISIEEFAPASLYPGQVLTIKGDYLNLIHEIVFAEKVIVSGDYFTTHNRYEIKVAVPEEAQTGKFMLGTVDETKVNADDAAGKALLETLNLIESETELVVGTAKATFPTAAIKAGAEVTINGDHLLLVKDLVIGKTSVSGYTATDSKLVFTLDEGVADGEVFLVMASGVEVPIGTLTTVAPSNLAVAPAPVKNGAALTISGKDLDLVATVDFPNAAAAEFAYADGKITVEVPEAAQEGDITLTMANGKSVTVAYTLVKPVVASFSDNPASAGSPVTLTGTDLDLVAKVAFVGGQEDEKDVYLDPIDVDATETSITVAVPTAAIKGKVKLILKNGTEALTSEELDVDKPAGAYIPVFPTEQYKPGEMFIVAVENGEHLTGVQVDGEDVKFILNGKTLYVQLPDSGLKADSQLTLVSDNGSVTYTLNIDPGDFIITPIWTGSKDIDWGGSFGEDGKSLATLAYGGFDWSTVKAGTILRIEYEATVDEGAWFCIALRHGDGWANLPDQPGQFDTPACPFDFELTQTILDDLIANSGLIISGSGFRIHQVSLVEDLRYGDPVWVGSKDIDWGGAFGEDGKSVAALAYGGFDWSTVKAGSTIFFHIQPTVDDGAWWCIALRHGEGWGNIADLPGQFDTPEYPFALKLTQTILDDLIANNGLIVSGTGYVITKISIK